MEAIDKFKTALKTKQNTPEAMERMADEFDKHMGNGPKSLTKKKKENLLDMMRSQEMQKKHDKSKSIKKGRKGGKVKGKGKSRRGRK